MPTRWRIIGRGGCDVVLGWASRCGQPTVTRDATGWRYCERHAELSAAQANPTPTTIGAVASVEPTP